MTGGPPHIALVCWGFPPFRGSGVFRPLAIANALVAAGADVSVVTASREVFVLHYGADINLEKQIDPRIKVIRTPFFPEAEWPLVNDWPTWRADASTSRVLKWDKTRQPFPEDHFGNWLPYATTTLRVLHQKKPISLIMATGTPYVSLEAASHFGLAYDVPVVLDDRDCSILNVYHGTTSSAMIKREAYLQEWLMNCAEMWFVNPPIADFVARRFPDFEDKIRVVENGWDPGVVLPGDIRAQPTGAVRAAYIGLIGHEFPLEQILEAWKQVSLADQELSQLSMIGALGFQVDSAQKETQQKQLDEATNVRWIDHVSQPLLHTEYANLDVLLFIKSGGAMVTGGKPYEYAATGLPIAALVDKESDTMRVLSNYPRTHQADPTNVEAIVRAIQSAVSDSRTDNGDRFKAAQDFGARLTRERQLADAIERVLELAKLRSDP